MKIRHNREKGFSLLEAVVVIGIMMVLMGIAIIQSFGSSESYQVNSAMDVVVGQLRVARQLAISQRTNVQVFFVSSGTTQQVQYMVLAQPGTKEANGPLVSSSLPRQTTFMLTPGLPDTPMNFGNQAAIYVGNVSGGPPFMEFTSTGQFTDQTGFNTLNGTLFIGIQGQQASTARAVTIMGGTGRVRPYSYTGKNWIE
jgi:type II secretory pathway pseudopilin PulG